MDQLRARGVFLIFFDLLLIGLATYWGAKVYFGEPEALSYLKENIGTFIHVAATYLVIFFFFDLHYPRKEFRDIAETLKIISAIFTAFLIVGFVFYLNQDTLSRGVFFLMTLFLTPAVVISRWLYSLFNNRKFLRRRAIILGCTKSGTFIEKKIVSLGPMVGIVIKGFLREGSEPHDQHTFSGLPLFGEEAQLLKTVKDEKIDLIILATAHPKSDKLNEQLISLRQKGVYLITMPALYESLTGEVPYEFIDSDWLLESCLRQRKFGILKAKRFFDICFALSGIILTSPIMALVAMLIKLDSKGPALFKQERLGQDAKPYQLLKFRTMTDKAEAETGAVMATVKDTRITTIGRFLRKFRIDELPQFFNVLLGEMSLIGPRPERAVFIRSFEKKIPFYSLRLAVKPGITGWAQVHSQYASTFEDIQEKFRYDLYYLKNLSFWHDTHIVILTIRVVLTGFGGR